MSRTPASYGMTVVRGSTWEDSITYADDAGAPVDLTGYSARMQVRALLQQYGTTGEPLLTLTTDADGGLFLDDPATGTLRITLDPASHAALNPANARRIQYGYAIELYIPEAGAVPEYVIPLVVGKLTVYGEVVR